MILDRFRLTDRAAIVTGAGRGIGAATAIALAEAGADVVISARTEEQLREVEKQIVAAGRESMWPGAQRPRASGLASKSSGSAFNPRRAECSRSTAI